MNVRSRLLTCHLVTARTVASKKTKPPTHYETLEVNSRATQGEIKSAYFKLSKQYHPDKNRSEEATAKFREISNAYEVLGSYDSRKTYDRSILTHTRYNAHHEAEKQADPRIKYYQSQAAVFRQDTKTGSTPHYDFDAWTKAHYGRTFNRTLRDRAQGASRRANAEPLREPGTGKKEFGLVLFAMIFVGFIMIFNIDHSIEGELELTIRQRTELGDKDLPETQFEDPKAELRSK